MKKLEDKEVGEITPLLDENIEIHPFNGNEYLVQHNSLNYQVNISEHTFRIVGLIDNQTSINEIQKAYSKTFGDILSTKFIYEVLFEKLAKYGIIKQTEYVVEKRKRAAYLSLSFIFINSAVLNMITPFMSFLFSKKLFYGLLSAMFIFITYMLLNNYAIITLNINNATSLNFLLYFLLFHLGNLFHEFGHAAACKKFGAKSGGIGFGFYLFTPALFTDVSDAWKLKRNERIIVNLAGIYFEMIMASLCLVIYFYNFNITFLILPCILILSTLYNLNPFIKLDGYWILSDLTNTPNLQKKAFSVLKETVKNIKEMNLSQLGLKESLLLVYALLSFLVIPKIRKTSTWVFLFCFSC